MGKLIPVILAIIGLGAGGGAGLFLKPAPKVDHTFSDDQSEAPAADKPKEEEDEDIEPLFVKINNQFVVPVVENNRVRSLVVLSISLETRPGKTELIYNMEPKLRDAFLRVMFDHAYGGGFDGTFTASPTLDALRFAMLEAAGRIVDDAVKDILITDIVRQDN